MNTALLRHAIENVWCNPGQDRQYVYRLARLTPRWGIRRQYTDIYERIALPEDNTRYHIYQTGRVIPINLGLPTEARCWHRLSDVIEEYSTLLELYTASGIQFPRHNSYFWITPSRNLLIAVPIQERIHDLEDSPLYLRLYDNAYWDSRRNVGGVGILYRGMDVDSEQSLLRFQRQVADLVDEHSGYPYYFVNGRFVQNVSLVTAIEGDTVEFLLDTSIKAMYEFQITEQPTFQSTLDSVNKYILHYEGLGDGIIEYRDDCDLFLYAPGIQDRFMGLTYHRNQDHWLRMVTHKDYSIPIPRLTNFATSFPGDVRHGIDPNRFPENRWESLDGKVLRLYLRHSGYHRPLVPEANRIQELYRLPSQRILAALRGTDSLVDVWRAANLEESQYIQFMSRPAKDLFPVGFNTWDEHPEKDDLQEVVGDLYGYHAAATILAGTPRRPAPLAGTQTPYVDLPWEHQRNGTVFEYDAEGELIDYHHHTAGRYYRPKSEECELIEALAGRGASGNTVVGRDPVEVFDGYDFRVYVRNVSGGVPTSEWRDITFADDRDTYGWFDYVSTPQRWVWSIDNRLEGAVRQSNAFVLYQLNLTKGSGQLQFSIEEKVYRQDIGDYERQIAEIPHGHYDLYLNGKALAEGVDYHIEWPRVVIYNLEYLVESPVQSVVVRGHGFCDQDLQRHPKAEVGFVQYGVLSYNHHYDIHTNKVLRVVVDGQYRHPDSVVFDEDSGTFRMQDVRNGAPYYIQAPFVNFREVYRDDFLARAKDDAIDRQISDYMTEYYPVTNPTNPDFIERPYRVISPFTQKLLHDIMEGWIDQGVVEYDHDHRTIREACQDYHWLLPFDLCNRDYPEIHMNVLPHWYDDPVELNIYQYRFLVRALEAHLNTPPDLAAFVKVI